MGRLTVDIQGRFLAGVNFVNGNQKATYGGGPGPDDTFDPYYDQPGRNASFIVPVTNRTSSYDNVFSPTGELRVNFIYNLTKAFALQAGYNALFIGDVTRASNHVDYTLPHIGLLHTPGEFTFVNGLSFGCEFNH